jgi:hypothetical protein
VTAPPLRITILSKTGAHVATVVQRLEDARIAPGQSHHFVIPVLDPPPTAEGVEVGFDLGGKIAMAPPLREAAHGEAAHAQAAPALRRDTQEPESAAAPPADPAASAAEAAHAPSAHH